METASGLPWWHNANTLLSCDASKSTTPNQRSLNFDRGDMCRTIHRGVSNAWHVTTAVWPGAKLRVGVSHEHVAGVDLLRASVVAAAEKIPAAD